MRTPIAQLIEEIRVDIHKVNSVIKKAGFSDHQKKIFITQKETLSNVLLNLEVNYLNVELDFINKLRK